MIYIYIPLLTRLWLLRKARTLQLMLSYTKRMNSNIPKSFLCSHKSYDARRNNKTEQTISRWLNANRIDRMTGFIFHSITIKSSSCSIFLKDRYCNNTAPLFSCNVSMQPRPQRVFLQAGCFHLDAISSCVFCRAGVKKLKLVEVASKNAQLLGLLHALKQWVQRIKTSSYRINIGQNSIVTCTPSTTQRLLRKHLYDQTLMGNTSVISCRC
jgi:hypothetical protein